MPHNTQLNIEKIKSEAPNAWNDFIAFYKEYYKGVEEFYNMEPELLPFSMKVGVLIEYFNDNGVEVALYNTEMEAIKDALEEAFITQENNLSHYS